MELKIISTGSHGNAYLLENDTEALLIECGVNFKKIKQAIDFDIRKIVGCILTHEHKDHSKAIEDVMQAGINVYSTSGTFEAMGIIAGWNHRAKPFDSKDSFQVGNFKILSFPVQHDAADPVGFLINHPETGNVLFLTDTYYTAYTFKGLNNIIIEANYCPVIAKQKLSEKAFLRDRIFQSHLSINTCIRTLQANDLSRVNNIVLIHLSDNNSHEADFKYRVQEATQKTVTVASDGMTIEFNKTPF